MLSFICPPIGGQHEPWLRPGASRFKLNSNPLMDSCSITRLELRRLDGKNRARTFVPFGTFWSLLCGIDGQKQMDKPDRRGFRTRGSLHQTLVFLSSVKHLGLFPELGDLATSDVGRSTRYSHTQSLCG